MNTHYLQVRVRYQETDRMGIVYHANYLSYFELGRVEWLRNKGLDYARLEDSGVLLPVVNVSISYKAPASYDQLLSVETVLVKIGGASLVFQNKIYDENKRLLVEGEVTLVATDSSSFKPIKIPASLLSLIQK
ncbi:MAG: Acyl-CoA thioester hydrolase YbgC [Flavobacteriaceae bacterium]|nr:acyl-CoA thioesterase [Flavobacteriaceae bacterium]CAI8190029.1 MAG: Acyl-CoA thioester hydrolase YbgC [Flavobacteriaceae bacterium]